MNGSSVVSEHIARLRHALDGFEDRAALLDAWGNHLGGVLLRGGRVLVAGNGGSAAHAQHLTSELVGRYQDERLPLAALALHADSSAVTAIANDYGYEQVFARQVLAHGRPGDVFVGISTSGGSPSVVAAAEVATCRGLETLAITGPGPNRLATVCDDAFAVNAPTVATVQELHQVVVHLLCAAIDTHLVSHSGPDRLLSSTPER